MWDQKPNTFGPQQGQRRGRRIRSEKALRHVALELPTRVQMRVDSKYRALNSVNYQQVVSDTITAGPFQKKREVP